MKRILLAVGLPYWMAAVQGGLWCLVLVSFTSCSYLQQRNAFSAPEEKVSKAEYDALLAKYRQALGSKTTSGPNASVAAENSRSDSETKVAPSVAAVAAAPTPELAETVDVFQNGVTVTPGDGAPPVVKPLSNKVSPQARKVRPTSDAEIERQIKVWRQAAAFVAQKKYDQALSLLRPLEKSRVKQIVVRSRFLTAEILYAQHEYDLAFQVYEEVIQQYAFSGLVLAALDRLVSCADKLNLTAKKEQYYSLLHDFFEAKS